MSNWSNSNALFKGPHCDLEQIKAIFMAMRKTNKTKPKSCFFSKMGNLAVEAYDYDKCAYQNSNELLGRIKMLFPKVSIFVLNAEDEYGDSYNPFPRRSTETEPDDLTIEEHIRSIVLVDEKYKMLEPATLQKETIARLGCIENAAFSEFTDFERRYTNTIFLDPMEQDRKKNKAIFNYVNHKRTRNVILKFIDDLEYEYVES